MISPVKKFWATWGWIMPEKLTKTQKFRKSQLALKNKIWSFARFLKLSFTSTVRNVTIWCALESPHLGQPFKYLGHHHITHRKFVRATWSWKMSQKLTKTQKFRVSQLALQNKIWSFVRFLKLSFISTNCNVTIWCALDSPGLGQPFKYLERYHITRRKVFRGTWSWKMLQKLFFQSQLNLSKFLSFGQFLRHFSTSGGSKKFSMSDMMMSKVFKRLP